ncbi:MAG: ABC transporter permease [candidate division Zixibacteria bacterium]|nr:ABC transporter permease [candidate division Zixibacteria bacterium]
MLKHYLKTAVRILFKHKLYTIINIFGLAIGLAMCFVVIGNVFYEFSYEDFQVNKDRIYRVEGKYTSTDTLQARIPVMSPLGPALKEQLPEVENVARFRLKKYNTLKIGNKTFRTEDENPNSLTTHKNYIFFTDSDYFNVFTFPLSEGNPGTALAEPNTVVITPKIVDKYFAGKKPMGETIEINDSIVCRVTGIAEEIPNTTQLYADFFVSYSTLERIGERTDSWEELGTDYTYLLMREKADSALVVSKITSIVNQNIPSAKAGKYSFRLNPLKNIYFDIFSGYSGILPPVGEMSMIISMAVVALFVMILAIANFINLATARYADRMKEIGVRKVLGAFRSHLVKQYLGESLIIVSISGLLSLILYELFDKYLQGISPRQMISDFYSSPWVIISIVVFILVIGLLAGFYPALYLSRLKPIAILQNKAGFKSSRSLLRKILVVFQFTVAIVFVFVCVTLYRQVNLITSMDLGFERKNTVLLGFSGADAAKNTQLLKREILKNNRVLSATAFNNAPGCKGVPYMLYYSDEQTKRDGDFYLADMFCVDYDFVSSFGLEVTRGRAFSEDVASDAHHAVMINESMVKELDLKEPVGHRLYGEGDKFYDIIGVVKDFYGSTLDFFYSSTTIIVLNPGRVTTLAVKIPPDNVQASLAGLRNTWQNTFPDMQFEYSFLDDEIDRYYDEDRGHALVFLVLSGLAILIACMGIFGLVSYTAQRKTKEIGIRKVLGATVKSIVTLLSKEFILLILISNVIAFPFAYLLVDDMLQYYPFKVSIGFGTFVMTGLVAVFFALITAGYQALRAALANPVDSLRCE